MRLTIPETDIMSPGSVSCQGCGAALAMRYAIKALGRDTMLCVPACCWAVIDGPFPYSSVGLPLFHTAFETAGAVATGMRHGLEIQGKGHINVLAWAGDGGTFDIGLQALSGAAERNEDILYVCYDNEAYMNTGVQRSSATPRGAWTSTTPVNAPKQNPKKDMLRILAAHQAPYIATACIGYPEDFIKKMTTASRIRGFKFLHVLAPCPPGWKSTPESTVTLARLAVQTRVFPLLEVRDGREYRLTMKPKARPVEEYLREQGRFRHLTPGDIAGLQAEVDARWRELLALAGADMPASGAAAEADAPALPASP